MESVEIQGETASCLVSLQVFFFIFFKRFIYFMYVSTLSMSSSDNTRRGHWVPLQMVVSHHVVAGN